MDQHSTFEWTDVLEPNCAELEAWAFWNTVSGIGPVRFLRLIKEFGTARDAALAVKSGAPRPAFVPSASWSQASRDPDPIGTGARELEFASRIGAAVAALPSPSYPPRLREIYDPPPLLYIRGKADVSQYQWVAIVGSRESTSYGTAVARRFAARLVDVGIGVASGLARGIDSAAHMGAVEGGGPTCGVLGAGIGHDMTARLERLVDQVSERGCVISSFPVTQHADSNTFRGRNRVISGMSRACIVVEAGRRSGALVTAEFALEQGRTVWAVPGDINRPTSVGANWLMSQGAHVLQDVSEVIQDIYQEWSIGEGLGKAQGRDGHVLDAITVLTSFDDIQCKTSMRTQDLMACLARLELSGLIRRELGLRFSRV